MGDYTVNLSGVRDGIRSILKDRHLLTDAHDRSPFQRVFPQTGSAGGAQIQGTSYQAMNLLGASGDGAPIEVGGTAYGIGLDPEYTAANAIVYVHFGDRANFIALRAGDFYEVPGGFKRFLALHGHGAIKTAVDAANSAGTCQVFGGLGFLVSRVFGARPNWNLNRQARGNPSFVGGFALSATDPSRTSLVIPQSCFVSAGLRGMRVKVYPTGAGGVFVDPPADFAATIRPWVVDHFDTSATPMNALPPLTDTSDFISLGAWVPNSDGDIIASQYARAFDRPVSNGALAVTFQRVSVAGAAVTGVAISVEGY